MKIRLIILLLLTGITTASAKNLLENSDFSKGERKWEGRWDAVTEGENTVAAVAADASQVRTMSQRFELRNKVFDLTLKVKYKTSPDYAGRGFRLLFERPDKSYTYMDYRVKPSSEWTTVEWDFSDIKGAQTLVLKAEVRQGAGIIYFDDFVLEPK